MQKSIFALAALSVVAGSAAAQSSSVTLYGLVDQAVRYSTNAGATAAANGESLTQVLAGMSQSRFGFTVSEDLGGGLRAIANAEHRINADTGTIGSTEFWRQSWVGLHSNTFGRVTIGRQYNVLFDAYTTSYPSFKYSPYIEAFKPEMGFAVGARNDNTVKYVYTMDGLTAEAQVSAGEGNATTVGANGKAYGGMLRYAFGSFAVAGAYLELEDTGGKKVKGATAGLGYSSGPLYVSAGWGQNKFESGFNTTLNVQLLGSIVGALSIQGQASPLAGAASQRDIFSVGATYQVTPELNIGAHYWHAQQDGLLAAGAADGTADAVALVADFALSKRTDAYAEVDHTKLGDRLRYANGAEKRTNVMIGIRHRF